MTFTPEDRLDTGMKVGEAISLASRWWDKSGRHALPTNFNQEETVKARPGVKAKKGGRRFPGIVIRDKEVVLSANLLNGVAFEGLTADEQRQVTRVYHHFFVRVPQMERGEYSKTDQVLTVNCDHPGHAEGGEKTEVFRGPNQINVHHQAKAAGWFISSTVDYCPACHGLLMMTPGGTA